MATAFLILAVLGLLALAGGLARAAAKPTPRRRIDRKWVETAVSPRVCLSCPKRYTSACEPRCQLVKEERQQEPERFEVI